ncbi:MAG: HIT domain-containing protein [Nitrospinae bacterium]|nr:HIT domain-containing protein [Nitrospinota bacterium]
MSEEKPLWAPWRIEYILGEKPQGCVFCQMPKDNDDKGHRILHRGNTCYLILNIYPYNNGHLMIVPFRHMCDYTGLTDEELAESAELTRLGMQILNEAMKPDGFNVGINQGKAAGAGIDEHLHIHIVPRWNGDNNFMPVIGQTKVIPQHLTETYGILAAALRRK